MLWITLQFLNSSGRGINVTSCDSYKQMYESAVKTMENKPNILEEQSQDLSLKSNYVNQRKSKLKNKVKGYLSKYLV